MADKASIKKQMSDNRARSGQLESENTNLERDIQELEGARDRLKACKSEYIRLQKETLQIGNGNYKWKGRRYDEGQNYFGVAKVQDTRNVNGIDAALDTVERDIGRLEAKRTENIFLINQLARAYYSLKHEFNALTN